MDTRKVWIDKTDKIERVLQSYPAVCLNAMPGSGRRTAIRMLLQKHTEVTAVVCTLEDIKERIATGRLNETEGSNYWYLLARPEDGKYPESSDSLKWFVHKLRPQDRLFVLADGVLPPVFLELIWSGLMEQVMPETFWFTEAETYRYLKQCHSSLNYRKVYGMARGWPGCTAILVRMQKQLKETWTAEELCRRYEVRKYAQEQILRELPEEEMNLLRQRAFFPRLEKELEEILWGEEGRLIQEKLLSRGVMIYVPEKGYWSVHPLFRMMVEFQTPVDQKLKALEWYEKKGYMKEVLDCCRNLNNKKLYQEVLVRNFDRLPFLQYSTQISAMPELYTPQLFYLRWMELLLGERFEELKELRKIAADMWERSMQGERTREEWMEVLMNTAYADPEISAGKWMSMLDRGVRPGEEIRLYFMLGESVSYLGGIKDLSELFACSKKERAAYRELWREKVAQENQTPWHLAEIEYEFQTDGAGEGTGSKLRLDVLEEGTEDEPWMVRLGRMYLGYLLADEKDQWDLVQASVRKYQRSLEKEEIEVCRWNTRALYYLAEAKWGEKEDLMRWIRETGGDIENLSGKTRIHSAAESKIHLYLGNYSRAESILKILIPYFEKNHSWKWLAESLFQRAVIEKATGRPGQALKTVAESLAVAGPYRYVRIYTGYGTTGAELLEEYRTFLEQEESGGTPKKRKYKYGSVLRMPFADWVDYIARKAGRKKKQYLDLQEEQQNIYRVEKLTVTEQMVLQYMEQGCSNAQISERMNIKLPTVKTHIYNFFKKMGVTTRIQAVQKGKEYGLL